MMKVIKNGRIYYQGSFREGYCLIYDEQIKKVCQEADWSIDANDEIIDAKGAYVVPGFVDLHIHGFLGCDVCDATKEALETIGVGILANGVTSYLATTMTLPKSDIKKALDNIREGMKVESRGARLLGAHLEGPFINPTYKGAQKEEAIQKPDDELLNSYKDVIKVVTLAPELDGALALIDKFKDEIIFNIGHSGADYACAMNAFASGVKGVTHLFNAMTGLHHREPGIVGAALNSEAYVELIADNIHVHPKLYDFVLKSKGLDKVLLVTDCNQGGGLDEGEYKLGGQSFTIHEGACRLKDGTLAGSVLRLNDGLKHIYDETHYSLDELLPLVTQNQSRLLGLHLGSDCRIGFFEVGFEADIVLLDEELKVLKTIVKGKVGYEI